MIAAAPAYRETGRRTARRSTTASAKTPDVGDRAGPVATARQRWIRPLLKHGMVVGINGIAELHSPHFP
jgi:hypothetical protein